MQSLRLTLNLRQLVLYSDFGEGFNEHESHTVQALMVHVLTDAKLTVNIYIHIYTPITNNTEYIYINKYIYIYNAKTKNILWNIFGIFGVLPSCMRHEPVCRRIDMLDRYSPQRC